MSVEPRQVLLPGRRALLVRLTANEGMRPALLDLLNTYADGLAEEPGTEMYIVGIDPDDDNIVWLHEIFRDEDAEEAHRASQGFAALMQAIPHLLSAPPAILRTTPLRMSVNDDLLEDSWSL